MSRAIGDEFEDLIYSVLGDINKTTNSGAKFGNGDLANSNIIIECKNKDLPRLRPDWKEIEKVIKQANNSGREWAYIQRNQAGTFVIVDFNFFQELFNKFYGQ
jgi:hypothetical protein